MIKRILVPVDFSATSLEPLDDAADLALRYQAELLVLHVIEPVHQIVHVGEIALLSAKVLEEQERAARHELEQLAKRVAKRGVACRTMLRMGRPYLEILAAARENDADMIVMGTHGRRGFSHLLIGSVAEKVVRTSECPVLTVRSRKAPRRPRR